RWAASWAKPSASSAPTSSTPCTASDGRDTMIEVSEILQTIRMVSEQHFDIRTITMGISLLDCKKITDRETAQAVYDKVTRLARDLVRVGGELESELGVPIVNKR